MEDNTASLFMTFKLEENMTIEEVFGWLGAILVLIAYFMISKGKAKPDSIQFQLINILGASFLIYYTYSFEAYASMAVNIIWVFIGLSSLITLKKKQNTNILEVHLNLKTKALTMLINTFLILTFSNATIAHANQANTPSATEEVSNEEVTPEDSLPVTEEESPVFLEDDEDAEEEEAI
jgi:hypothetical protein